MHRTQRYGRPSLQKDLPTEAACLAFVFDARHTRACSCGGTYRQITNRKAYQCSRCRFQIAPLAGTIFHKSSTPLTLWFHAVLLFSNAKSGISAKYLERELEVTYKTAYRILKLIRRALGTHVNGRLRGEVEVDTGFFGGRKKAGKNNENMAAALGSKIKVIAAFERGGEMKAEVVATTKKEALLDFLMRNVKRSESTLFTDAAPYPKEFDRVTVNHSKGHWAVDMVHINTVETFFSHVRNSIRGTFKVVSPEQFQTYLDVFVFQYNNRHSDKARFEMLMSILLPRVK